MIVFFRMVLNPKLKIKQRKILLMSSHVSSKSFFSFVMKITFWSWTKIKAIGIVQHKVVLVNKTDITNLTKDRSRMHSVNVHL